MFEVDVRTLKELDCSAWDREISAADGSTYCQTSFSAAFEEAVGPTTRAVFFRARQAAAGVGWLLLLKRFPYERIIPGNPFLKGIFSLPAGLFQTCSWNYGPLFSLPEQAPEILESLLSAVDRFALESKASLVRQALPAIHAQTLDWDRLDEVYLRYGYQRSTKTTVILRVKDKPLEELWLGLEKDIRRTVRKARSQGVTIIEATTPEEIDAYFGIRLETARRNGLRIPPRDYFQQILRLFPRDVYKIFLASQDGRWVSGQGAGVFNGIIILGGVCYSDYAKENSLYGNDLMQWHLIEWACRQKASLLDWAGYFREPVDTHEEGINRYKLKWGGEITEYPEYSKIFSPLRNRLLNCARRLFSKTA